MQNQLDMSHRRFAVKPATAAAMASITLTIGELVCNDSQLDISDLACRRFLITVLHGTGARLQNLGPHEQSRLLFCSRPLFVMLVESPECLAAM